MKKTLLLCVSLLVMRGVVAEESKVIELVAEEFASFVENAEKPVVVDFYATWCGPCQEMKPVFEELASEEEACVFASINIDKAPLIAAQYHVAMIPAFVVFKEGKACGKIEGRLPKGELWVELEKILAGDTMHILPIDHAQELIMALSQKNIDVVKTLLSEGADPNVPWVVGAHSFFPLEQAVLLGYQEGVELLTNSGALMSKEVEEAIRSKIVMHEDFLEKMVASLKYAEEQIAMFNFPESQERVSGNQDLLSRFTQAIQNRELLEKLLEEGLDVNTVFSLGVFETTPLALAIFFDSRIALDLLISKGALLTTEVEDVQGVKKSLRASLQETIEEARKTITQAREILASFIV